MAHGLWGRGESTAYLRDVLRVQWRSASAAERHYTLVFPPLIFSFFGARTRWPAAQRGLQEHTELTAKGWRWITMQPCGLCPNLASRAPLAVGLSAPRISQPCRVTALDQARTRPKPRLVTSVESGREAPPSWRDDGGLTRSGTDEERSRWRWPMRRSFEWSTALPQRRDEGWASFE